MEQPATHASESSRWGHAQLSLLVAEILGRNITVIIPDDRPGEEGLTLYKYSPGFATTFGAGGYTKWDLKMHGVWFCLIFFLCNSISVLRSNHVSVSF